LIRFHFKFTKTESFLSVKTDTERAYA
jgi:hypothetical protein